MNPPEFLCAGHLCHDKIPGGYTPGGAVSYAGLLAARLGYRAAALTSFGQDFLFGADFLEMILQNVPAAQTTVFENIYQNGSRIQFLHGRAADLTPAHLPAEWQKTPVVLLCPIADEVSFDFLDVFENSLVCVCPQGWMRRWDASGKVFPKSLDNWAALAAANIISISENDVNCDWQLIDSIGAVANLLIVTQGALGATVFQKGQRQHFPAFPVREVNPTGAGDVFAAAFSLKYAERKELPAATAFAHAAASFCVERKGGSAFQPKEAVEERAASYF